MEIIGALKKSRSQSTIFFCEYKKEDFDWNEIVTLLQSCRLMQDLEENDIYCVAVESRDEMKSDRRLVGITFHSGSEYVSLVPNEYADLDFYLKEISGCNTDVDAVCPRGGTDGIDETEGMEP